MKYMAVYANVSMSYTLFVKVAVFCCKLQNDELEKIFSVEICNQQRVITDPFMDKPGAHLFPFALSAQLLNASVVFKDH